MRSFLTSAAASRGGYQLAGRVLTPASDDGAGFLDRLATPRANYRGRPVTLLGGPAVVIGCASALLRTPPGRLRRAAMIAVLGAGGCGLVDDLFGDSGTRGLAGHLGALGKGRFTSGNLKIAGIGAAGLAASALATESGSATAVPAGLVVALSANLANLLDLRPGRVGKVALVAGAPLIGRGGPAGRLAAIAAGGAAGLLPADLGEQTMIGDAGANALGALLGLAAIVGASRPRVYLYLAALAALTVASEVVSFSAVIDRTPALRFVDSLGRRAASGPRTDEPDV
jgi:UDP-GlcNAc:undecaprenyl-phosphate GlcNAc-1-phosphate transferase